MRSPRAVSWGHCCILSLASTLDLTGHTLIWFSSFNAFSIVCTYPSLFLATTPRSRISCSSRGPRDSTLEAETWRLDACMLSSSEGGRGVREQLSRRLSQVN
ncbi:hypothetical protein J3E69DRAFT_28927 [Trichoderma sp. SZMC 28015]